MWRILLINYFSDISFSQGNVATRLRCGGIFSDRFIANFQQIVTVKEFRKSASIWWSYAWKNARLFFSDTVYIYIAQSRKHLYCARYVNIH